MSNPAWIGRVLVITDLARSRYFKSNSGLCSLKFLSDCGRPASSNATFNPASANRLHAQPPEAPEPTTMTSNVCLLAVILNQILESRSTGILPAVARASCPRHGERNGGATKPLNYWCPSACLHSAGLSK